MMYVQHTHPTFKKDSFHLWFHKLPSSFIFFFFSYSPSIIMERAYMSLNDSFMKLTMCHDASEPRVQMSEHQIRRNKLQTGNLAAPMESNGFWRRICWFGFVPSCRSLQVEGEKKKLFQLEQVYDDYSHYHLTIKVNSLVRHSLLLFLLKSESRFCP